MRNSYSVLIACFLLTSVGVQAQLVVDGSATAEDLAESLLGSGVTISDITLDCASGAYGTFECIDCNAGIPAGIVLTSGSANVVEGPNTGSSDGADVPTSGDPDLDAISGFTTYDACILEFDVTVTSDTLQFNYVFGSEEYTTYVNSSVNDAFGLFISGPGITGSENLALIPGTSIGISINTVNPLENEEYYIDNGVGCTPSFGGCTEGILGAPYTTDDYYIGYDGFTTVLVAKSAVIPCETYHLKLAIADAGDGILDSGVLIEAGSLSSPGVSIAYDVDIDGYFDLIEGCNNGYLTFDLSFPPVDSLWVPITVEGTATNGEDYTLIPDSILFEPGDTLFVLPIDIIEDAIDEGLETIVLYIELGCAIGFGDSLVINILDYLPIEVSLDTLICPGGTATLTASGADTYEWSPPDGLSSTTGATVGASPDDPVTYTVTGTLYACVSTAEVNVDLEVPVATAYNDTTIFFGETATLGAEGGVSYSWSPAGTLSNSNTQNPVATPLETTTYTVTITTELGCNASDQMTVFVSGGAEVWVPNAFTPNGDGFNDFFNIISRGQLAFLELNIYNRWGQQVYAGSLGSPGWDGYYKEVEQPIGSYVYTLNWKDTDGNGAVDQGQLTLVR